MILPPGVASGSFVSCGENAVDMSATFLVVEMLVMD